MYFETLATNSGRPTETCTCHQTAASGGVAETGGIQSDTETGRGGNVPAAEAHQDLRDPTADERATGEGAERGGPPNSTERTNGRPDTATGGQIGIGAEVETGRGVEVETESKTGQETGVELKTGSTSIRIEVKRETVETKIQTLTEEQERGQKAQAEKERNKVEKGAPRNQIQMRNPLMRIPTHAAATNSPKRARRRARRSIRRKAICQK